MKTIRCPICRRLVSSLLTAAHAAEERAIWSGLSSRHQYWNPTSGLCEQCLFREAPDPQELFRSSVRNPVAVLPLPLRLDADPRFTGSGVTIAFIDSGFFPHPDLTKPDNRLLSITDVTSERHAGSYFKEPHWESWHGTMSAVVACGNGFRSKGLYKGLASCAKVVGIKVMDVRERTVSARSIAAGIRWVIDHREELSIRILSIAVGADEPEYLEKSDVDQQVEEAVRAGLVVVVAAGNRPGSPLVPPSSAPSAITVGGYDDGNDLHEHLRIPYHSTWGITLNGYEKPNVVGLANSVPGPLLPATDQDREARVLFEILRARRDHAWEIFQRKRTLVQRDKTRITPANLKIRVLERIREAQYVAPHHKAMEGTSIAAALVASIVAQMMEANPMLSPREIRQILLKTAEPMAHIGREQQGHGMVSARRAVERALTERHPSERLGPDFTGEYATFLYEDHDARTVSLAGELNGWDPEQTPFHEIGSGRWSCLIPFSPGKTLLYKIVVDGEKWIADPSNTRRLDDGYGGWNSVLDSATHLVAAQAS
jgi:serine protease AprX